MVGSLGTQATAAVGSTSTVNWLIGSTVSAIGVGLLAFISQSFGADVYKRQEWTIEHITWKLDAEKSSLPEFDSSEERCV